MLNVFDLHLSTPEEKAVSRICASKTRRNLQTFGWCLLFKQSCPWALLSSFCSRKTSREVNATQMSQKSSALSILFKGGEGPLQFEFTNLASQITTTSLVKFDRKGGGRKGKSVTTSP
jgi:hypothetical protein